MIGSIITAVTAANPDSTQTSSSGEYRYSPSTSLFGLFDPVSTDLTHSNIAVVAYSDFYTASNCFTVNFIRNFFGSGFITDQMKADASANLLDLNTIGIDFYNGVWFMMRTKKDDHTIFIGGIDYNFEESSQFSRDLFHVVFYGNYDMQGLTADFSKSKFSLTSTMEYKAGLMKIYDKNYNTYKFGVTGGLVQGLSGLDINAKNTTLYTAPDGRYLDLAYDLEINTSGNNKPSLTSFNGAGFSFDAFGQIYLQGPDLTINAMVNDLGMVFWTKDPLKISGDSTQRFEGVEIDNLFGEVDSAAVGNTDSLLEIIGVVKEENAFSQALPSRLNASISKGIGETGYITLGSQFIFNTPYKPLIFIQAGKSFIPLGMTVSVNAHAGGYGGYNAGLDISKSFGRFLQLKVGSNSLLGTLMPDNFTGAAAYANAIVRF